jgi:hypothetical protein
VTVAVKVRENLLRVFGAASVKAMAMKSGPDAILTSADTGGFKITFDTKSFFASQKS